MKLILINLLLIICLLFSSCLRNSRGIDIEHPVNTIKVSDLNLEISFVPLDFGVLGSVGEVSKFYFFDNFLFVLDSEFTKGIHVFDEKGNFVRFLQSMEKLIIWGFIVDESKRELVLFVLGNRFERFTLKGSFIKSWKLEMPISRMIKLEEDKLSRDTGMEPNAGGEIFNLVIMDPENFKPNTFFGSLWRFRIYKGSEINKSIKGFFKNTSVHNFQLELNRD